MTTGAIQLANDGLDAVRRAAGAVADPDSLTPGDADRLLRNFDQIERTAAAVKALLARRVTSSDVWKREGRGTPGDYLASVTGTTIGAARGVISTSEALAALPATRDALLAGELSAPQAQLVADAAKANPAAEADLLASARRGRSHKELKDDALRAKAAADADLEATHARIHEERRCATSTDAEGAWNLHAHATPADGAIVTNELDILSDEIFEENRKLGRHVDPAAYRQDALKRMAERSQELRRIEGGASVAPTEPGKKGKRAKQPPPKHLVLIHVDAAALRRGSIEAGERCEIPGVGPLPLKTVLEIVPHAALKLIISNGVDVLNVTSLTRRRTQAMDYALLWTNPICSVEGCTRTRLEFDHIYGKEYAKTRHTKLVELAGKCAHHHRLHTVGDWELEPGVGKRPIRPPDHPDHPRNKIAEPPPLPPPPRVGSRPAPGQDPHEHARQIALQLAADLQAQIDAEDVA